MTPQYSKHILPTFLDADPVGRTFATESVRNGMNLFYVQSLLGHSSLTMTRIYAEQVNSEDAIKAYKPIVR